MRISQQEYIEKIGKAFIRGFMLGLDEKAKNRLKDHVGAVLPGEKATRCAIAGKTTAW